MTSSLPRLNDLIEIVVRTEPPRQPPTDSNKLITNLLIGFTGGLLLYELYRVIRPKPVIVVNKRHIYDDNGRKTETIIEMI